MKPRRRKVNRLDDRNLRGLGIATASRAADSLASAMKNLQLENLDVVMVHLIDVFDYLMETKNVSNEVWRRYTLRKRDNMRKGREIRKLKQSPSLTEKHCEEGMEFVLFSEETKET